MVQGFVFFFFLHFFSFNSLLLQMLNSSVQIVRKFYQTIADLFRCMTMGETQKVQNRF